MCNNKREFRNLSSISRPISVNLPDGSIKLVTRIGNIQLTPKLILKETLYTPCFRFNLLSVNKLSNHVHIKVIFYPTYCIL